MGAFGARRAAVAYAYTGVNRAVECVFETAGTLKIRFPEIVGGKYVIPFCSSR